MAKNLKKLLSLAIVVTMVLSMIPAVSANQAAQPEAGSALVPPADAEWIEIGTAEKFATCFALKANMNGVTPGDTRYYRLTADITVEAANYLLLSNATTKVNTYIDLGGHTLTYAHPTNGSGAAKMFESSHAEATTTIVNGTITNNGNYTGMAGPVFNLTAGTLVMQDVNINVANTSTGTGGINNLGGAINSAGNLTMINCNLTYSSAYAYGRGGLVNHKGAALNMTNCTFDGGKAVFGGNICIENATGEANLTNCEIKNGRADGASNRAGNLYVSANLALKMDGCTFTNGYATAIGGNVAIVKSNSTNMTNCTFTNGTTAATGSQGGNIHLATTATATMTGCQFTGGSAVTGGNISLSSVTNITMTNCTVTGGSGTTGPNLRPLSSTVIIKGGEFTATANTKGDLMDISGSTVSVYGATLTADNADSISLAGTSALKIYDATVIGMNPTAYVPETCSSVAGDGPYTVTHNDVEDATVDTATCAAAGTKTITCATCDHTYTYASPKKDNHDYKAVVTEPTCTAGGFTTHTCSVCGDTYKDAQTEATGHAWGEWVIDPKPTCNDAGVKTRTCGTCGETETEAVEATGHTEETVEGKAATCTETGLTEGKVCTVCGETTKAQEEIAALGHTEETVEGKAATCTETGLTEGKVCTVCGETTKAQEEIAALGHEWSEEIYNEETEKFEKICEICEKTEAREPGEIQITAQPVLPESVAVGTTEKLSVAATGEGDLTYLWLYSNDGSKWYYWAEPAKDLTEIEVKATVARDGYKFKCQITDAYGKKVVSEVAALDVVTENAIVITEAPVGATEYAGESATFTVEANGNDLTYLWKYSKDGGNTWYYWAAPSKDMVEISVAATLARDGYKFICQLTDANGVIVTTDPVELKVNKVTIEANVEIIHPAENNGTFVMDAEVEGDYTYLWKYSKDGGTKWYYWQNPGKDAHTMTGVATAARDGYQFKCQITDALGNVDFTDVYVLNGDVITLAQSLA